MSGLQINNNLDELFALLNFLDPKQFNDLAGYKKRFENLDSELVQEVQSAYDFFKCSGAERQIRTDMLKPRFLRRVKERVLDLPPLHSIIVPMSLRPLQKRVRRRCSF